MTDIQWLAAILVGVSILAAFWMGLDVGRRWKR
jgi:hypothetical protein